MKEKNKIIGKVCLIFFNVILDILLVLVFIGICIGVFYSFQVNIKRKEYADIFGYTFFEVATGSMEPTIKVRRLCYCKNYQGCGTK